MHRLDSVALSFHLSPMWQLLLRTASAAFPLECGVPSDASLDHDGRRHVQSSEPRPHRKECSCWNEGSDANRAQRQARLAALSLRHCIESRPTEQHVVERPRPQEIIELVGEEALRQVEREARSAREEVT